MTHTLDSIKRMAQREANRDNRTVGILNLNPYNPLYVIREMDAALAMSPKLILVVNPETHDEYGGTTGVPCRG